MHYDWLVLGLVEDEDDAWDWPAHRWLARARQQKFRKGDSFQGVLRVEAEEQAEAEKTGKTKPVQHRSEAQRERAAKADNKPKNADRMRQIRDEQVAAWVAAGKPGLEEEE